MKQKTETLWQRISLWLFFGLLAYIPLHILLSTWLGTSFHILAVMRVAKEAVLMVGAIIAFVICLKRGELRSVIKDRLTLLILAFVGLNIILAIINSTDLDAELLGLMYNVRFLAYFLWAILLTLLYAPKDLVRSAIKIVLLVGVFVISFGICQYLFLPNDALSHLGYVKTNFVAGDIQKHYPFTKSKLQVTYESCEPPLKANAVKLPTVSEPFIMHVGSPFPHKNIEGLIDAFAILKKSHPKLQLALAGKNEDYFKALQDLVKDNPFQKDIVFTGFVSDSELKWLYQHAETYVLPSLSEGFGLVGLEAMVHGCPVVSSNATCLPEVFGSAAEYFDPKDPKEIAQKVDAVISNEKRRKELIHNGYTQLKKYSWRKMAEQTLQIYQKVIGD